MLAELLTTELFIFILLFVRIGTAFMVLPGFGEIYVPTIVRLPLALAVTLALAPVLSGAIPPQPAGPVALTGGMAASDVFARMLANVLDAPVAVQSPRGSAIGAVVVASRPRRDWAAAAADLAGRRRLVEPNARAAVAYRERFERWRWLRSKLDDLAEEL